MIKSKYIADSPETYERLYKKSIEEPETFWSDFAATEFVWKRKWDQVLDFDLYKSEVTWFSNAQLNITENCIDRYLGQYANRTAIIWEPNDPNEEALHISYETLGKEVNKTANMLKSLGIKKGDRVCLYMPMVPELCYAMLACARIGAVHSVVFAGFSSRSLSDRINDANCKILLTADGGLRGQKITLLKEIADEALKTCPGIEHVVVLKRAGNDIQMKTGRDIWWSDLYASASVVCEAEPMDAEDILFILYTSGSTGKPKGMVHTCAGYMVYANFTFRNVFQYREGEVYWCTADIGWITGHSYIVYGPLSAGATTLIYEGIPGFPDMGRFWDIVDKHKVNIFYTAPTAIRSLAQQDIVLVKKHVLDSLRVLGTVGEPINKEAWNWYYENIGKNKAPIVDTWWQTETGGIMISALAGITPSIPAFATLPLPGVQACLMDEQGNEIEENEKEGRLCIKFPWPGMARTIYGDHKRFEKTYFTAFPGKYFTGDGARRDASGNYRITGRVDDVLIVSGHNLGTAEIENAINEHENVAESAVVGYPHQVKGNGIYAFVTCKKISATEEELKSQILERVSQLIGPVSKPDKIQFVKALPKTRSGKIMRRILKKIAAGETDDFGDTSTLLDPEVVEDIRAGS